MNMNIWNVCFVFFWKKHEVCLKEKKRENLEKGKGEKREWKLFTKAFFPLL